MSAFCVSMRQIKFEAGQYYHIYNRGVDKRRIFENDGDYRRFMNNLAKFNSVMTKTEREALGGRRPPSATPLGRRPPSATPLGRRPPSALPLVKILAFCLLPNHFHLLVQQVSDRGISRYLHRIQMGYTHYFNGIHDRSGILFQGKFKAKPITSHQQLIWLSAYIHGNPDVHGICKAQDWKWSSYQAYLKHDKWGIEIDHPIFSSFENPGDYGDFVCEASQQSRYKKIMYKIELE